MTTWEEEVPRLARLARLRVEEHEAAALAAGCEAIAREFGELAAYAGSLLPEDEGSPGPLRPDEDAAAPSDEVAGILAATPRVDARTRAVLVPRGQP